MNDCVDFGFDWNRDDLFNQNPIADSGAHDMTLSWFRDQGAHLQFWLVTFAGTNRMAGRANISF